MERRHFFNSASRWFLMGGILGFNGLLMLNRQVSSKSTCSLNLACKHCERFDSCEETQRKLSANGTKGRK